MDDWGFNQEETAMLHDKAAMATVAVNRLHYDLSDTTCLRDPDFNIHSLVNG